MKINKALVIAVLCTITTTAVYAKLPAPQLTDEQKTKAGEAKAKAADVAKKDGELLTQSQDRLADRYIKAQKAKGITVKPTQIAAAPAPAPVAAAPAKK